MGKPHPELLTRQRLCPAPVLVSRLLLSSWGAGSVDDGATAAVSPGAEMSGVSSKTALGSWSFPWKAGTVRRGASFGG